MCLLAGLAVLGVLDVIDVLAVLAVLPSMHPSLFYNIENIRNRHKHIDIQCCFMSLSCLMQSD